MKNRNLWIAYIIVFILLVVPLSTLFRGFIGEAKIDDSQKKEILSQNGTYHEDKITGEASTQQDSKGDKRGFEKLQQLSENFIERAMFRKEIIYANTMLTSALTNGEYLESNQVLAGKENYLFYKTKYDGYPIYDYMGINHFTEDELNAAVNNLTAFRDYLEARGIAFYAIGIPSKESVYEEFMPDTVVRVNGKTRADQISEYIWSYSDIKYIYPKQELLAAKKDNQIYFKTDTHWNAIGAFIGFQAFFEEAYGEKQEITTACFDSTSREYAGDLAMIANITEDYAIDTMYEFVGESADQYLKKNQVLVVVGDSFGGAFTKIAKEYYKQVEWIDPKVFTLEMLDEYKPDVLIFESVERYIERFYEMNYLN